MRPPTMKELTDPGRLHGNRRGVLKRAGLIDKRDWLTDAGRAKLAELREERKRRTDEARATLSRLNVTVNALELLDGIHGPRQVGQLAARLVETCGMDLINRACGVEPQEETKP